MRCKTNALLEINHSIKQKHYVDWLHGELANLVNIPPSARAGNGDRIAYRFVTRSLPALTPYFRLFYGSGGKRIPDVQLTPLTMAVWFMDDGSKSRSAVYLNTQQFERADQEKLLFMLQRQCAIEGALNRDKIYHRIRLTVPGTARFIGLIEPFLRPEFRYKLPQVTP